MRCPKGEGLKGEKGDSTSKKTLVVQKQDSASVATALHEAEAKAGFMAHEFTGIERHRRAGKINGQDATVLWDTGCDQTLVHGRYVPASAFTGQSVDLRLADGSTQRAPLAIVQLECEDINGEYPVGVLETLPEDTLLGNDIVDGERHAYVVTRRQCKLQEDRDAEAEHQAVRTGVKATSVADDLGGHGKDQDQMGPGTQGDVLNLSKDELQHLQETDVTLKMARQHVVPLAEVPENRVCFYWKQGLLYRKWLPSSEDNEVVPLVQELHQIVVPKVARGTSFGVGP